RGGRAETIGGQTADGDEDRERQQIGGDRKLERQGARADVGGDCRQRGRDDGRVHALHEQGDRHDQGDDACCQHWARAAALLGARERGGNGTRGGGSRSQNRMVWGAGRSCPHVNRIGAASDQSPLGRGERGTTDGSVLS